MSVHLRKCHVTGDGNFLVGVLINGFVVVISCNLVCRDLIGLTKGSASKEMLVSFVVEILLYVAS